MPITLGLNRGQPPRGGRRDPALARLLRMLERLGEWAAAKGDRVGTVYLVRTGDAAALYLVATAEAYDFDLARELSEFAAPHMARGVIGSAALVPACPPEELEAFFDPKSAFRIAFE